MHDETVVRAETACAVGGQAGIPGNFWIEFVPFLKWIPSWVPGAYFKAFAEQNAPYVIDMKDEPYNEVKRQMVSSIYKL